MCLGVDVGCDLEEVWEEKQTKQQKEVRMSKRSRNLTKADVKFIYENYSTMSAAEIAEELGISKFMVMKTVTELRKRGVDIPKKTGARKINPIDAFVAELRAA